MKELETLRQGRQDRLVAAGRSGDQRAADDDYDALASLADDLRFVLITSAADASRAASGSSIARHAERARRSASAAGTIRADVGSAIRCIRRFADAASRTSSAPASARAFA